MLATVVVLALVTLQARRAESALDEAVSHTLRDYTGYAGRMMGAEVLRRFAEQRASILSPVTGSAGRAVPAPALEEIIQRANQHQVTHGTNTDPGIGYFRLDLRTGAMEARGAVHGQLGVRIADTLPKIAVPRASLDQPDIAVVEQGGIPYSVAFARLIAPNGKPIAVYGFTYTRSPGIAAVADEVFRETPLLPISFAGPRWNYDTTRVMPGEVVNDSLLAMRITDRGGHALWQSRGWSSSASSPYGERVVLRTSAGGIVVESALRPASEPTLVPTVVRRAQRWSLGALVMVTMLLAVVSLLALRGERRGARARRAEAMQQLALGLRHELNNALASVMLNAEVLREEGGLDADLRERLQAIVEQAERMRRVLRRLEKTDRLDVVVPYLNEGFMVDLSSTQDIKV